MLIKPFLNEFYARSQGLQNPRNERDYYRKQSPLGETYSFSLKTDISRMYFILLEQMTDLTEDVT